MSVFLRRTIRGFDLFVSEIRRSAISDCTNRERRKYFSFDARWEAAAKRPARI